MANKRKSWQTGLLIGLLLCLWWMASIAYAPASDLRLESRINRLESDLGRLRSQVSRIESQLSLPSPATPTPRVSSPSSLVEPSLEEQFDNLATLAIETKLQLRALEARVADLEAGRS